MLPYIVSLTLGYLIGSFPTAYFLVQHKSRIDIRNAGSGNVGARNAFEVTGSRFLGFVVLTVDLLKGAVSVFICYLIYGKEFWVAGICGVGAVLGHIYSLWINFRGGRGLATTAGVMVLLCWVFIPVWLVIYSIAHYFSKHVRLSSVIAAVITPFVIVIVPGLLINSALLFHQKSSDLFILSLVFSSIILIGHIRSNE